MSRYTGPRVKILRALGVDLPGLSNKSMQDRPQAPGQHGAQKNSGRKSEFGLQLLEKQKLRYNYGLREGQLRRVVAAAKRRKGATGQNIVELLERRLDNLVFRAGFAPTIPSARQMIGHGHFMLNGRRVTIPSIHVRDGDVFGPNERGSRHDLVRSSMASPSLERPEWLRIDSTNESASATLLRAPESAPFPVDLQRVVEYYAIRN